MRDDWRRTWRWPLGAVRAGMGLSIRVGRKARVTNMTGERPGVSPGYTLALFRLLQRFAHFLGQHVRRERLLQEVAHVLLVELAQRLAGIAGNVEDLEIGTQLEQF